MKKIAAPAENSRESPANGAQSSTGTQPQNKARRCSPKYLFALSLGALGVVYGDIGTSPLYALRECFYGEHAIAATHENVLGVLSLIFWSLLAIISVKYITFVMRADNKGEGGILALMSLAFPEAKGLTKRVSRRTLVALGVFGASLLYGDGMITPSITEIGRAHV